MMIPFDKDNNMPMNHHFKGIIAAAHAAHHLCKLLPPSDLKDELSNIILIQCEIINSLIEGKHFGHKALDNCIEYAIERSNEAKKIKDTPRP
jgi:hypothetical protein